MPKEIYEPQHGDVVGTKIENKIVVGRVHSVTFAEGSSGKVEPVFVRIHTVGENMELESLTVPVGSVTKL